MTEYKRELERFLSSIPPAERTPEAVKVFDASLTADRARIRDAFENFIQAVRRDYLFLFRGQG